MKLNIRHHVNLSLGLALALFLAPVASRADEVRPDCYVLSVGVDVYGNPGVNNLHGCVNDARTATERFLQQQGKRFGKVHERTLTDKSATRSRIDEEMTRLKNAGKAGDFVVFFFSGHGGRNRSTWHFLPHDYDPSDASATGVSDRQLLEWADAVAGQKRKVLVIIDACFAGQIRLSARQHLERHQDPQGGGIILMLSSMPGQTSAALGRFSAFAEAVAEALAGRADLNGDRQVTLAEVRRYAYHRTYELLRERGMKAEQDGECDYSPSISESTVLAVVEPAAPRSAKTASATIKPAADSVADTTWSGSEDLKGYGKLSFRFHDDGVAVMIDARGKTKGSWLQDGSAVTIVFSNCVYRGRIGGEELSGTAGFEARPRESWSFRVTLQTK